MTRPLALAAALLVTAGCASSPTTADPGTGAPAILAKYDLAGLDGREIVDRLERGPQSARPADLRVSVRPGELQLAEAGSDETTVVDLPDQEFYLSVAPYVEQTHECYFHSLTTCRGELAGEEIHVRVVQQDTGEALVDQVTRTFDNGFVGFWLPSGIEATITVEYEEYAAAADIATGPDDPTCLTTLHLVPRA